LFSQIFSSFNFSILFVTKVRAANCKKTTFF